MRKLFLLIAMMATMSVQSGCIIPIWSASPDDRVRQMIYQSENYRQIPEIWERVWFLDMPDLATPFRTHGGVI
ncbi:hypothetical protein [Planctomicrobium piriforme]|uniref:Uncharacterized protein n=1 Tax=Planctomicrobium piriforme TaxID=1576369 RepID=A0A1I3AS21_9PLAN|nr:hypothetical protein [Planctomicrobium piriforme]SFH52823.1 hypothetical protein SAMN05421753_10127 [Planctomicrobium piriforme]